MSWIFFRLGVCAVEIANACGCAEVSISSMFFERIFCTKACFWCQYFVRKLYFGLEMFGAKISYKKRAGKTLKKLTSGCRFSSRQNVNKCQRANVIKRRQNVRCPGVNFTNVLFAPFSYESVLCSFFYYNLAFVIFRQRICIGANSACKCLVKLTTSVNFTGILQAAFLYKKCFAQFFVCYFLAKGNFLIKWWWNWLQELFMACKIGDVSSVTQLLDTRYIFHTI